MKREVPRMAGVLMPVASLPSGDGVGTFGRSAYQFVDFLAETGFAMWQVLPLNPLGYGNSPYQPYSSYAGDELYIDLEFLKEDGYLPGALEELPNTGRVDYDQARRHKLSCLEVAFTAFEEQGKEKDAFDDFCKESWVYPYAVFITLKKHNDMRCWNEWPQVQRDWILEKNFDISPYEREIRFEMFLQYIFSKQWNALKRYANDKGVLMVGDVPFYVGIDSLDVWQDRESFLLDQDGKPTFIAGVPPDYFSVTGQRWGNPIYNWEHLEKTQFRFWIDRLRYSARLYDIIRIDHFRAFDTYWKIPAACETAIEGEWIEAPGYALFDKLLEELPDIWLIAEDLGDLRPEVLELRDAYDLPGMNVAEFTLLNPKAVAKNQVIYTGTHDNQTVMGWYNDLDAKMRKKIDRRLGREGRKGKNVSYRMLHYVLHSVSDYAIIPLMDLLELDDTARLNTPGTVGSPNWEWRLEDLTALESRKAAVKRMIRYAKREKNGLVQR